MINSEASGQQRWSRRWATRCWRWRRRARCSACCPERHGRRDARDAANTLFLVAAGLKSRFSVTWSGTVLRWHIGDLDWAFSIT
jgi:hypothetical protein